MADFTLDKIFGLYKNLVGKKHIKIKLTFANTKNFNSMEADRFNGNTFPLGSALPSLFLLLRSNCYNCY